MSEIINKGVYAAIAAVSAELAQLGIAKSDRNQAQGFNYRGIDALMTALSPALVKHGLLVLPRVLSSERSESPTKTGGVNFGAVVTVDYLLVSVADGSSIEVTFTGEGKDSGDKANSKALSMAYKYFAFQTFCIPVEGQDDADAEQPAPSGPVPADSKPTVPPAKSTTKPTFDQVLAQVSAAESEAALTALRPLVGQYTTNDRFLTEMKTAYTNRMASLKAGA